MRVIGIVLVAMLVGCMLVVSPDEYGSTCRFEGSQTQCGSCIASKCQAQVNECCRDPGCDHTVDLLDSCAQHGSPACADLLSGPSSLSACVKSQCAAVCTVFTGTSQTSCREPRLGEGSACECSANGPTNDFICNRQAYPRTVCCAPQGWPAPGLECTCRALDCRPATDGCFCSLANFTPKQSECTAVTCCVDKDTCSCRARECRANFETKVDSCEIGVVKCGDGQVAVESCSIRVP